MVDNNYLSSKYFVHLTARSDCLSPYRMAALLNYVIASMRGNILQSNVTRNRLVGQKSLFCLASSIHAYLLCNFLSHFRVMSAHKKKYLFDFGINDFKL